MSGHPADADIIDLTAPADTAPDDGEVLRLDSSSPFEHLSEKERARLIVRVLCELVAYGDESLDHSLSA